MASDRHLLDDIAAGDRQALRVLFDRHGPMLVMRLHRRCADPDLVDEVVQDTLVAVWRGAARYRGSGEVAAWIWGIAIRRLLDALRRRPAATMLLDEAAGELVRSAEEQVLMGMEYGDLPRALNRLAPELRAVLQATVLDGLTAREAAQLLGIPVGTVKTRLMRARGKLRRELA